MRIPAIDNRSKKDIIKYIKAVSEAYTPEWRFDEENPDVGAALAMIYADMTEGSIRRFNRIPEKYRIAFFNEINASRLPAVPSFGYVTFKLSGAVEEGEQVPRGTRLTADAGGDEGYTVFETVNDVCVIQAEPRQILCANGANDFISRVYEASGEDENALIADFTLFDMKSGSLQEHAMYFCSENVLNISNGAWIALLLDPHFQNNLPEKMLENLLDNTKCVWEYCSEDGWTEFAGKRTQGEKLLFFKSEKQPRFVLSAINGIESYWIRCRALDIRSFEKLHLDMIKISATGAGIEPDCINSLGTDQNIHEFFPFGPAFSIYNDVYIGSEDALGKKGAMVRMDFTLSFAQVPIELDVADPAINWKLIMKRNQFKIDQEYDITIGEVIWEYFNGYGWAKLFEFNDYNEIFSVSSDGTMTKYVTVTFRCPDDMEKVLINATESCYIRARIIKVNNAFKVKGNYVSPVIEGIVLSYTYENHEVLPDTVSLENNLETQVFSSGELNDTSFYFTPFVRVNDEFPTVYTGFENAPKGGPVRILICLKEAMSEKPGRLNWEYYGNNGWTSLSAADETENFMKTGIVTFMGPQDFRKKQIWGQDMYWIRIVDVENRYGNEDNPVQLPEVTGIYMNATNIRNTVTGIVEFFYIEPHEENHECRLLNGKVQETEVDVLEDGQWVRWQETQDFSRSGSESRHYVVDRNEGIVRFSDGNNGKIPPSSDSDSIRITYSTGGGNIGNLPPGAVNRSSLSIGFVNQISNPGVTFGGCDEEDTESAVLRNASAIKHGYRGVTAGDFEALALEATRNILRAKCFSGYKDTGERMPGAVTLVVLQKNFETGRDYFDAIKIQVKEYIEKRISGDTVELDKFFVTEPQFLEMCIKVELTVSSYNLVFKVRDEIQHKLTTFLNPMTGNFDGQGWAIGRLPNNTQVMNCLKEVSDVKYIKSVFVTAYTNGRYGRVETDLESMKDRAFALPLSGKHNVVISVDEGR